MAVCCCGCMIEPMIPARPPCRRPRPQPTPTGTCSSRAAALHSTMTPRSGGAGRRALACCGWASACFRCVHHRVDERRQCGWSPRRPCGEIRRLHFAEPEWRLRGIDHHRMRQPLSRPMRASSRNHCDLVECSLQSTISACTSELALDVVAPGRAGGIRYPKHLEAGG